MSKAAIYPYHKNRILYFSEFKMYNLSIYLVLKNPKVTYVLQENDGLPQNIF